MAMYLFRDWLNDMERETMRPSRLMDQHFGLGLSPDDLMGPLMMPSRAHRMLSNYYRPWRTESRDAGSTLQINKDEFRVDLDVQQFRPEEVTVRANQREVTVEASHEEKQDEHGFISRKFSRRYVLPEGYDMEKLSSALSSDGVLTVMAPKAQVPGNERVIPITQTGQAHKIAEKKDETLAQEASSSKL